MLVVDRADAVTVEDHYYLSTACLHAEHEQCRRSCKFCAARCHCHCHDGKD